jgi:transposase-like protein
VSTTRHTETIEVVPKDQRLRRWSVTEKAELVQRTYDSGMTVSLAARQSGVAASLLFQWQANSRGH